MGSWLVGVELRCDLEATFFPACCGGEGFLLGIAVGACCVEFVVAAGLEVVKDLLVVVERGDASTRVLILEKKKGGVLDTSFGQCH